MVRIKRSGHFDEMLDVLTKNNKPLEKAIFQKINWFVNNTQDTRLDNHKLEKRMKGKWAFSITEDVRIVYKWLGKKKVRFFAIGPHKTVYN